MAPHRVEALNFGVPGYGLADVERLIREQVLQFRPDGIVLMFYNGNDFLDTYLGLERYSVAENGSLLTNGQVLERKIPEEFRPAGRNLLKALKDYSYLARLLTAGLNSLFPADRSTPRRGRPMDRSYTSNLFWSQTHYPEFAVTAKETTLEALARLSAEPCGISHRGDPIDGTSLLPNRDGRRVSTRFAATLSRGIRHEPRRSVSGLVARTRRLRRGF